MTIRTRAVPGAEPSPARQPPGGRSVDATGAASGLAAGTVALALGQVGARLVPGATPPLQALGDLVVRLTPIGVTEAVIAAVGRDDKTLLLLLVTVVAVVLVALTGVVFTRGRRRSALLAVVLLALAPAVAVATAPVGNVGAELVVLLPAALIGAIVLWALGTPVMRAAPDGSGAARLQAQPTLGRRQLLRAGLVLMSAAALGEVAFRALGAPSKAIARRLGNALPAPARPLPPLTDTFASAGASPLITPLASFYRIDTALDLPQVDPERWRLQLTRDGQQLLHTWSYDEMLGLATTEADITIGCVSNEIGGDLIGTARWQGVSLQALLARAGVTTAPGRITGVSVDGFVASFPGRYAFDGRAAMLAVGMNGQPLPVKHGFPARLIVPGLYGYTSATKWLTELDVSDSTDLPGFWADRGWTPAVGVHITSRVDSPQPGAQLVAGPARIAGIAWAPIVGVGSVEVQIDDGPWRAARLAESTTGTVWRQFVLDWSAAPGTHRVRVRAADVNGHKQDPRRRPVFPSGATGLHQVVVHVT